jgi:hypothetical protein
MAQGFFIQLGFTAIFYNIALSCYYDLAIVHNWKERQFQKYKLWFHVPAVVIGTGLSFGGIPFYYNINLCCWILPYPYEAKWVQVIFGSIPFLVTLVVSTVSMIRVTWAAEKTSRKAQKWRKGTGDNSQCKFLSEVRWQATFYLGAFYLSWPILALYTYIPTITLNTTAWGPVMNYMTAFLFPLQGFWSKAPMSVAGLVVMRDNVS